MILKKSKINMNASIQIEIDNNNNKRTSALGTAYAESLKMILQHVADFHLTVVEIISEKYNISVDEMMKAVTSDPRYANMAVNPEIHRLVEPINTTPINTTLINTTPINTTSINTTLINTTPINTRGNDNDALEKHPGDETLHNCLVKKKIKIKKINK